MRRQGQAKTGLAGGVDLGVDDFVLTKVDVPTCISSEIQIINSRDDSPDLFVHFFEDSEEISYVRIIGNRLIFVGTAGKRGMGIVNVVRKQSHIKRAIAVTPDEIDRAVRLDLHPLPTLAGNDLSMTKSPRSFNALRIRDDSISQSLKGNQGFIESIRLRQRCVVNIPTTSHVPFAEVSGHVDRKSVRFREQRCVIDVVSKRRQLQFVFDWNAGLLSRQQLSSKPVYECLTFVGRRLGSIFRRHVLKLDSLENDASRFEIRAPADVRINSFQRKLAFGRRIIVEIKTIATEEWNDLFLEP